MTTIRRRRLAERPPEQTDGVAPRTAGGADEVRLALIDPPAARTTLDGAWWPRTRSLLEELPGLVEELRHRGIRVSRVAYNPDGWEPAPRRLAADGRIIRLGWFRGIDAQLLNLTGDPNRGRLDLLVIPPDTTAAAARQAFAAAVDRANRSSPTALLAALPPAGSPAPRPRPAADQDGVATAALMAADAWDSEGGHPLG